ncbi:MAG: DUF6232 family protein [Candidatus Competibacterales bacterium]|nr:DUF6232 family protein [Candidatus Competibacterales bacterium]
MKPSKQPKFLMDEAGIQITRDQVTTPNGDFPLVDIHGIDRRVKKPLLGPVLLALLGTVNTVVAMNTGYWLDIVIAGLMLGGGIYWRLSGTRHVLVLRTPKGEVEAWFARRESELDRALEIIRGLR